MTYSISYEYNFMKYMPWVYCIHPLDLLGQSFVPCMVRRTMVFQITDYANHITYPLTAEFVIEMKTHAT